MAKKQKMGLIGILLVVLSIFLWFGLSTSRHLQSYQLTTPLNKVNREALNEVVAPYLKQSFWQVDLTQLHADIQQLSWVYHVKVRRGWPDKLILSITEQTPVVRWGDKAFLNELGQIFYPNNMAKDVPNYRQFVKLNGEDILAKNILQLFIDLQKQFNLQHWRIDQLDDLADGVLRIHFLSGSTLLLNQQDWRPRLTRFQRALPKVVPGIRKLAQNYDLRYSNGFVIQEKSLPVLEEKPSQPSEVTPIKLNSNPTTLSKSKVN